MASDPAEELLPVVGVVAEPHVTTQSARLYVSNCSYLSDRCSD